MKHRLFITGITVVFFALLMVGNARGDPNPRPTPSTHSPRPGGGRPIDPRGGNR